MATTAAVRRDAEAELNLPPGFRFHPTDEELVAHYLCARAAGRRPPVPIIAELDLYRFDPWDLPERALFGRREWYFFTPRDRKYPNGSRPNRAAGAGYWKATGADKPVTHGGRTVGIKKALVFYQGKPPRGVKTEWIMHEYRLPDSGAAAGNKKKPGNGSLRLDDWVLCRLYNKKNEWEKMQQAKEDKEMAHSQSHSCGDTRTPESGIDDDPFPEMASLPAFDDMGAAGAVLPKEEAQEMDGLGLGASDDWFSGINLDDLQVVCQMPGDGEFYGSMFVSPTAAKMEQDGGGLFF